MVTDFTSFDEAVRATFPPEHCRVVAAREHGDHGFALFDTRPGGHTYLYGVHYDRSDGRWSEGASSNGSGWQRFALDGDLGVVADWGEAPRGADRVRIELEGDTREEPVSNGLYLVIWWDIPQPKTWAGATWFRVRGEWIRAG